MKNRGKVYIAVLLLFCGILNSYGQKHCIDSINVKIDNNIKLNMAIYDYSALRKHVENDLKSMRLILTDKSYIPENVSYTINYEPDRKLSIQPVGTERIIWENGKSVKYPFNNQCFIHADSYSLQIQFNEIDTLLSDRLIKELQEVIDTTSEIQGRFSGTYNYSFHKDKLIHNRQFDDIIGQPDVFSIKPGIGLNIMVLDPVLDFSLQMSFTFNKKGIWKNEYYLSYNQLSDFGQNGAFLYDGGFLNIGYRHNRANTINNSKWLGYEFGYLIVGRNISDAGPNNGNAPPFYSNTFKLGVNWQIGSHITVSPQLFVSGSKNFSNAFLLPSIRLGFQF